MGRESQSIFAFNRYNPDFGNYLAFSGALPVANSFTFNRTEFLGRNGRLASPAASKKKIIRFDWRGFRSRRKLTSKHRVKPGKERKSFFPFRICNKDEKEARKLIVSGRVNGCGQSNFSLIPLTWWERFLVRYATRENPYLAINFAFNRWLQLELKLSFLGKDSLPSTEVVSWFSKINYKECYGFALRSTLYGQKTYHYGCFKAVSRRGCPTLVDFLQMPVYALKISDYLLWLPFVTAQYVRVTNDTSILQEEIPFIKGELLKAVSTKPILLLN